MLRDLIDLWRKQEQWQDSYFYFSGSAVEGYVALTIDDGPLKGDDTSQNLVHEAPTSPLWVPLGRFP